MNHLSRIFYHLIAAALLLNAASFSTNLHAATKDFSKIKRDINVMTQVIKGTFENSEECTDCKIKIESSYLAAQGAVFSIAPSRGFSFIFNDRDFNFRIPEFPDAPEDPTHPRHFEHANVEIVNEREEFSRMVEGIVEGVELGISGLSNVISGEGLEAHTYSYNTDSADRDALRDLRRTEREIRNEIREYEIELIHAEDENRIAEIDAEIARLNVQAETNDAKKDLLREQMEMERHIIIKKREAKKEHKQQQEKMKYEQVERIALSAFCDYGSMLKNLPDKEHISLIFKGSISEGKSDQIYVFTKSVLNNCNDRKSLVNKSIKYEF